MNRYLIICMALFFLFSCEDPYKDNTFQAYDVFPTSTYLDTRPDDFSMWVEILHYADLYNAVNQASQTFTSFVPDNQAVQAFYTKLGITSIEEMGLEYARNLVQYHIINAEISQKEFTVGGKLTKPTVSGDYLSVSFEDNGGGGLNSIFVNEEARVIELANPTTNGLVYVLNTVLTPLVETLYDRLEEDTRYSLFREAIELSGWKNRLDTPYDTVYSDFGRATAIKRNFTLFAVSNEIFAQQGVNNVNDLVSTLGAGADYTSDDNALRKYIGYHLISQTHYIEDLFPFGAADSTIIWSTQAANEVLSTNSVDGDFYVNYTRSSGEGSSLVDGKTDILAKNGIIHEVNNLMPVMSPDPMTVIWDLCAFPDIESVVNAYGAANNLGDCYQKYQSAEHQIDLTGDEITSFEWKANSSASTGSWRRLGYLLTKANSGATVNTYGAYLNDMLVVNLGYMGNVKMQTPVLLKGKYKVELYYACAGSLSPFINGGSQCQFSLDDQSQEVYVYDGAKASVGIYNLTMFSEVEFDNTSSHDFKIVLLDPRATTSNVYRLQLDYVKFIPIFE